MARRTMIDDVCDAALNPFVDEVEGSLSDVSRSSSSQYYRFMCLLHPKSLVCLCLGGILL